MSAFLTPRRVFVYLGVLLLAAGLVRDRDLLNVYRIEHKLYGDESEPRESVAPEEPTELLYAAVKAHGEAGSAFSASLAHLQPALKIEKADDSAEVWTRYEAQREESWPAYAAALDALIETCEQTAALEPDNGVHEATAALAELEHAVFPSAAELVLLARMQAKPLAAVERVRVVDPLRLESALARLERALEAPRFNYGSAAVYDTLETAIPETLPLETFIRRYAVAARVPIPNLLSLRSGVNALSLIAYQRRALGGDAERPLRLGRRLGLRVGADTHTLIELMIGVALIHVADEGWVVHAAETQNAERAKGVFQETAVLERHFSTAFSSDTDRARMGALDPVLIPSGGYREGSGFDPDLGRRTENAFFESFLLWALALIALAQLPRAWSKSRLQPPPGAPLAPGWTLGDLLGVVLPSFGLAAVGALLLLRLHPARSFGVGESVFSSAPLMLHCGAVLSFGALSFPWLLRRAALRKLGLGWTQPSRARWVAAVAVAGFYVATAWIGAGIEGDRLAWLAIGLVSAAGVGGLLVYRLPGADPALKAVVRRMEGRVGLAGLGLALSLIACVQLVLVAPRRDALVRRYGDMHLQIDMPQAWGEGQLQNELRRLLETAPDGPRPRATQ